MKVLFISNWLDGTGWAKQGIDSILALDSVGVDVVPRAIKLNGFFDDVPERIRELEAKSDKNPDIIILNTLPSFATYSGRVRKNILYYQTETSNFKNVGWSQHINIMDEGWIFSRFGLLASKNSGVKIPLKLVRMPVDVYKFKQGYGDFPSIRDQVRDGFVFYTISEFTKRKNIETLLRAYHSEFHPEEDVYLLIKTTDAAHGGNIHQHISNVVDGVKRDLRIYKDIAKYKKELILCGNISATELYKLHQTCDAFVTASHAEGWCMPCFDAMGFGKTIVAPKHTAFTEYLNENNSYLVDSYEDNCYGAHDTLQNLYSVGENWFEIPVTNLRKQMRSAYEQRKGAALKKADKAAEDINKFSYQNIGNIMASLLGGK